MERIDHAFTPKMTRVDRLLRGLLPAALLTGLLAGLAGQDPLRGHAAPAESLVGKVVISQFRAIGPGGGNDEFIELFNLTSVQVDISGWQINTSSTSTGIISTLAVLPTNTVIPAGGHFLVVNANAPASIVALKDLTYDPNQIGTNITNNGGIALIDDGVIIDQVGMDTGSAYKEGTILSPLTGVADQSYERKPGQAAGGNCTDTDDNASDFSLLEPASPQNSASPAGTCNRQDTTTSILSIEPTPAVKNETVKINFEVTLTGTGSPTGNVYIYSDDVLFCQNDISVGNCSGTFGTVGTKKIIAKYEGDNQFIRSFSDPVSLNVVNQAPTVAPTGTYVPTTFSVVINEVAWAGTIASPEHEWIELYNRSGHDINLNGWWIQVSSIDRQIPLSGTITASGVNQFFLLERNEDAVPSIKADILYEWQLLDDNDEILTLYRPGQIYVDSTFLIKGKWPAGTVAQARSMERRLYNASSPDAWVTYAKSHVSGDPRDANNNYINGTPKKANWGATVALTPSPTATRVFTVPTARPQPKPRPIINEFLPRAGFDWNNDGRVDVFDEFIEVANLGPADWNTRGWRIDDEADGGSPAFTLPQMTLKPGERAVFYGSQSNIHLSDGGDTVRLLDPSGKIYDAQTYTVVKVADVSWCRLPDQRGSWFMDCFPTPNFPNSREGTLPSMPPTTGLEEVQCKLADTLPEEFILAECKPYGDNMWSSRFWDLMGWVSDRMVKQNGSKWESFVE